VPPGVQPECQVEERHGQQTSGCTGWSVENAVLKVSMDHITDEGKTRMCSNRESNWLRERKDKRESSGTAIPGRTGPS
jgi:hypothetical protein